MKNQVAIIGSGLVLAALALGGAVAQASTLLSGYGGPGQGNQAILGSTLLNGPRGGSGSGGSGSSGGGGATSAHAIGATAGSGAPASSAGTGRPAVSRAHGSGPVRGAGRAAAANAPAPLTGVYPASERGVAGAGALGLTSADFVYLIVAIVALAVTAVLTRRLVHVGPAKEQG